MKRRQGSGGQRIRKGVGEGGADPGGCSFLPATPSVASVPLIRVRGGGGWDSGGFSLGSVVLLVWGMVVFF